jgi:exportin-2 (importin alpha re-exporter)
MLQLQISEVVTIIANVDFPSNWPNLLQDLIQGLTLTDLRQNIGVLQTAHSIFKRWRKEMESNELYNEVNYVMKEFAPRYLQFFQAINTTLTPESDNLLILLPIILLLLKIFYSLNCQDLPEFFEDNMPTFMEIFKKLLTLELKFYKVDQEAGDLEKIKACCFEIVDMYSSRYEADFKQLPEFVQISWGVLTNISMETRNDVLVSKAITFLTSVVKHERHRGLFENEGVLNSICEQVVLPNMNLRGDCY